MRKPFFFNIDVLGGCNLACPSCPMGNDDRNKLPKGLMSPKTLEAILQKAKRECVVLGVGLFNWTEPFLHPRLPELIEVINRNGLLCYLSSNLNKTPSLMEVLAARPHSIRVSMSGYTNPIYQRTHKNGDVEIVKRNLRDLAFYRDASTHVHVLWHRYKHNLHEEGLMRNLCDEMFIEFRPIDAYYMPLEKVLDIWEGKSAMPALNDNLLTRLEVHKSMCAGRSNESCRMQTQEITLDCHGRVQLCCAVFDPTRFNLGLSYLDTPIDQIQSVRTAHDYCGRCARNGGHVYAAGLSQGPDCGVKRFAKAVYRRTAPLWPTGLVATIAGK